MDFVELDESDSVFMRGFKAAAKAYRNGMTVAIPPNPYSTQPEAREWLQGAREGAESVRSLYPEPDYPDRFYPGDSLD